MKRLRAVHYTRLLIAVMVLAACSDDDVRKDGGGSEADASKGDGGASEVGPWPFFALDEDAEVWGQHPFPSDARFPPGTAPSLLSGGPLPGGSISDIYEMIEATRTGATILGGLMLTFSDAPDRQTWPAAPATSADPSSPLLLIELGGNQGAGKPSGRLIPFRWRYFEDAGSYHEAHTLRVVPDWGFSFEPNTRYVFAARRGSGVGRSPEMERLLTGRAPEGSLGAQASQVVNAAVADLESLGYQTSDWTYLQVLTTDDPMVRLAELFADTTARTPPAELMDLELVSMEPDLCRLHGRLPLPQFQKGAAPSPTAAGGGYWVFDEDGHLVAQREELVQFSLILPRGQMPAGGWPLVVYVGGATTTHDQLLQGNHDNLGLGVRGWAGAMRAAPHHPDRDPSSSGLEAFLQLQNPRQLVDTLRQNALENALFLRALLAARLDPDLCPGTDASASVDGQVRFRSDRIGASGCSLGSLATHIWISAEPLVGAVAPMCAGGNLLLSLSTAPTMELFRPGLRSALALAEDAPVDPLEVWALFTTMAQEIADPSALVTHVVRDPLPGVGAKHYFTPIGYIDEAFGPESSRSFIGPVGAELAGDPVHESLIEIADAFDRHAPAYPVSANVDTPDGPRTSVVTQFLADGYDGHNLVFTDPGAQHQLGCFFETYFATGIPVVVAPGSSALDACDTP